MAAGWAVTLDGVTLSGGDLDGLGCLTVPPDGLGLPEMRTEDVTYPQRDGVRHFSDWYSARIITLEEVLVCADGCPRCPSARQKVHQIVQAWSRRCDDAELVIWTDCDPAEDDAERAFTGPYGVVGRPRVAEVRWERSNVGCAELLLRFDAIDHRLYVLDQDGQPGSGEQCVELEPVTSGRCRTYPRCYTPTWCYNQDTGDDGSEVTVEVTGTLCASPTIELYANLTDPIIENVTTGEFVGYRGSIGSTEYPVIIDTETGTATQGGASRTHLLTGNPRMSLDPGETTLRLVSYSPNDNGRAVICWRPSVGMA